MLAACSSSIASVSRFAFATTLVLVLSLSAMKDASASIQIVSDPAKSTSGLGQFEALLTLTNINSTEALLQIQIANVSNPDNGGFITGLVFNNPSNLITSVAMTSAPLSFRLMGGSSFSNSIAASPFGDFDIGAGLSATNFNGSGNPNPGLGVGDIGSFEFLLTGSDLSGLTEQSFIDALSEGAGDADKAAFFLVRFRGFEDGGSDKSVGKVPGPGDGPNANSNVPEPTTMLLWLGLGTAMLFVPRSRAFLSRK